MRIETSDQLRGRPFEPLLSTLRDLGAAVESVDGRPPFVVRGPTVRGGDVSFADAVSSQFASALLIAAPRFPAPVTVRWGDVSRPYVELTLDVLRAFGADLEVASNHATVRPGPLRPSRFEVEGDASSAAFLIGAAAISGGDVRIPNVPGSSRQADRRLIDLLADVGCATAADDEGLRVTGRPRIPFDVDLVATSDLVPIVAAIAATIPGRSRICGVAHVRVKESDRIAAMAHGLRALGVGVEERPDGLVIDGGGPIGSATIDPRDDHRIAMAFAALGRDAAGIEIADADCVGKSFPGFFSVLEGLRE